MVFLLFATSVLTTCGSKEKVYRIGIDTSWYPLRLMGKEANLCAFTKDLLLEMSQEEGVSFEKVVVNWENLLFGLKERHYDGVLTSIAPSAHMRDIYEFSEPILYSGLILIIRSDSKEKSNNLTGKRIATTSPRDETLLLKRYPGAISCNYSSIAESLKALVTNDIDAIIADRFLALRHIHNLYQEKVEITSSSLDSLGLYLITLQGKNKKLTEIFNQGLKKMHNNGTYDRLLKKWKLK